MPFFDELVFQGADPGANLGGAFTASLAERELVTKGNYLHEFIIGMKHANATAANTAEDSLNILQPFVYKAGSETRIQMRGRDLFAYSFFMTGKLPVMFEADAATDNFKVLGLRIPVWETTQQNLNYAWSATRVALTNASGEVLELAARWSDKQIQPNPLYAVEQAFTTAAATGRTNLNIQLPKVGDLIGLLMFNTAAPTGTADASSVQRIQLYVNGNRSSQYNVGTRGSLAGLTGAQDTPYFDVLANYSAVDLREDPLDAKANNIEIEVDVQDASDAVRLIPIMIKK